MLELGSGMICAIFRKFTRHHFPLLSLPPSIQMNAQPQEAQAKDCRRGSRHDHRAMQTERIDEAQFVCPAQRSESKPNALFAEHSKHHVIVVAIRIAEDRQARADFSLQIFERALNLLSHSFGRNLRHEGVCSCMRSKC